MISSIMRTVLMPTARGQRVLVETISLFQLHYRTVHGIRTTKSEGQALRVSLVKPGAYLSASYLLMNLNQKFNVIRAKTVRSGMKREVITSPALTVFRS
jgi:hypothetical protein